MSSVTKNSLNTVTHNYPKSGTPRQIAQFWRDYRWFNTHFRQCDGSPQTMEPSMIEAEQLAEKTNAIKICKMGQYSYVVYYLPNDFENVRTLAYTSWSLRGYITSDGQGRTRFGIPVIAATFVFNPTPGKRDFDFNNLLTALAKYGRYIRKARQTNDLDHWVDVGYMMCVVRSNW